MKFSFEIPNDEFSEIMKKSLIEYDQQKAKGEKVKLFSINQVAKKLGFSHATVKKLIKNGLLKATKDNKITAIAINEYLQNR